MADIVRRLTTIDSFQVLQDKMENWSKAYYLNTWDQNVARGLEIALLSSRIQDQILKVVSQNADEGVYRSPRLTTRLGESKDACEYYARRIQFAVQDAQKQLDLMRLRCDYLNHEVHDSVLRKEAEDDVKSGRYSPVLTARSGRSSPVGRLSYRARSPSPVAVDAYAAPPVTSSLDEQLRIKELLARYSDLYYVDRVDTMRSLNLLSRDHVNNERIVFATVAGAFETVRQEFNSVRAGVRSDFLLSYVGPPSLDLAVLDYIRARPELCPLEDLSERVLRLLRLSPILYLPSGYYDAVDAFLRKSIRLAWDLQQFLVPVHALSAVDGEFVDEVKYRRSAESDFGAPLADHFIWPCLVQGARVVARGELTSKLGASSRASLYRASSDYLTPRAY